MREPVRSQEPCSEWLILHVGFAGGELKDLGKPGTDCSHNVTLGGGVNGISGQKEFRQCQGWGQLCCG